VHTLRFCAFVRLGKNLHTLAQGDKKHTFTAQAAAAVWISLSPSLPLSLPLSLTLSLTLSLPLPLSLSLSLYLSPSLPPCLYMAVWTYALALDV
jgi:hypothetical protein